MEEKKPNPIDYPNAINIRGTWFKSFVVVDDEDDAPGDPPGVIKGVMDIAGADCHVYFIRVEQSPDGEQHAVRDLYNRYGDLLALDTDAPGFETIELPGYAGDWVLFAHSFGA